VNTPAPRLTSRRAFLRAAVAVTGIGLAGTSTLAGCDLFGSGGSTTPPTAELDGLLANTVALGHEYDATISAVPELTALLTPLRDAHRAHAEAIAASIGRPVPSAAPEASAPPTDRKAALVALRTAEKTAQAAALAACLGANERLAPLLGSITAARASHQEVLT
jgi:hypothetical protein